LRPTYPPHHFDGPGLRRSSRHVYLGGLLTALVATLLKEPNVSVATREREAAVGEAEEILILVVDKPREALLAHEHLDIIERLGLPTSKYLLR
jgi:hypothetical protein